MLTLVMFLVAQGLQGVLPTINVFPGVDSIVEGGTAYFRFTSDQATGVNVRYQSIGAAQPRMDFSDVGLTNGVQIPVGALSQTNRIFTHNDSDVEALETVTLRILPNPNYLVGPTNQATLHIVDNDFASSNRPPAVFFSVDD